MTARQPIDKKIPGLRQRQRADRSWRIWWEPNAPQRALGMTALELDADKLAWSARQATARNDEAARLRIGGPAVRPSGGRSMDALIEAYRRDPEFLDKAAPTRKSYIANMRLISRKWGSKTVSAFSKPIMREWYLTLTRTAGETQAQRLIGMMSILFSYAEMIGWRPEDSNPCRNLKLRSPKPRTRIATTDEIIALLTAADTCGLPSVGTAILLSVLQGQRQTDIIDARRSEFRQVETNSAAPLSRVWAWQVDRSKRGTLGLMQLHPNVLTRMLPWLKSAGIDPDHHLLIEERTAHAYDLYLFQRRWTEVRTAAADGQPDLTGKRPLQFRDLRRTFSVMARGAGASDDDVGDVLGNSAALDPRLQETYMPPSFETASRAVLSIEWPRPDSTGRKS